MFLLIIFLSDVDDLNITSHDSKSDFQTTKSSLEVLIVAGMSGILAAIKLAERGIKFKI